MNTTHHAGVDVSLGTVLTYENQGGPGAHGQTLGADGCGAFSVLFFGAPDDARHAAVEYIRRHRWLAADIEALVRMYPDHTAQFCADVLRVPVYLVYKKANQLGLQKSAAFLASPASGRLDGMKGSATRFKAGQPNHYPCPKGTRLSPGTEFRKGDAPPNVQEVGALRINSMGDIDIKVAPGKNQWMSLRRYVWETEVGPIPPEMCVAVRNHDPHDTRLENLVLLTRAENIAHNLLRRYPKELRSTMQLAGRIRNRIKTLECEHHA